MDSGRRIDVGAVRQALSATTLTLRVRPAVRAWEALERELQALGVTAAVRDELACATLEAIAVAAFRRRIYGPEAPPPP